MHSIKCKIFLEKEIQNMIKIFNTLNHKMLRLNITKDKDNNDHSSYQKKKNDHSLDRKKKER